MNRKAIRVFEATLDGIQEDIALYRKGAADHLVPHGLDIARERLEMTHVALKQLGLHEICSDALLHG